MTEPKIAKAGKLLCVDSGEYSDYSVHGFFVVLRDFDPMTELADHLEAHPEQRESYRFEKDSYLAALLANGLLMEVDYGTLYVGSYSSHESVIFTPAAEG
jgi:hypothetical protein